MLVARDPGAVEDPANTTGKSETAEAQHPGGGGDIDNVPFAAQVLTPADFEAALPFPIAREMESGAETDDTKPGAALPPEGVPLDGNSGELLAVIGRVALASVTAPNGKIMNSRADARDAFKARPRVSLSSSSSGGEQQSVDFDVLMPAYFADGE